MSEINNIQINTKYINVVMSICNLIEYSNNYIKIIKKHQDVYGNTTEINQLRMMMVL